MASGTDTPSIELDPWWEGETLVWASNATGSFQIHQADHQPITSATHGALLPRAGNYLELTANGWRILDYEPALPDLPPLEYLSEKDSVEVDVIPAITTQAYDPFKSLWPNYIQPDIFAAIGALQLGVDTNSRDVTGDYIFSAGFRYSFESDFLALQGLIQRKTIGARYSRYPSAMKPPWGKVSVRSATIWLCSGALSEVSASSTRTSSRLRRDPARYSITSTCR